MVYKSLEYWIKCFSSKIWKDTKSSHNKCEMCSAQCLILVLSKALQFPNTKVLIFQDNNVRKRFIVCWSRSSIRFDVIVVPALYITLFTILFSNMSWLSQCPLVTTYHENYTWFVRNSSFYSAELFKMVCENNETDLDIGIPAVMLPQDAGVTLENFLKHNTTGMPFLYTCLHNLVWQLAIPPQSPLPWKILYLIIPDLALWFLGMHFCMHGCLLSVSVQLYSPLRPLVDIAEVFLWLMAVGTILCASYWSAWSAKEAAIEQDKLLKVILWFSRSLFGIFERGLSLLGLNPCWISHWFSIQIWTGAVIAGWFRWNLKFGRCWL